MEIWLKIGEDDTIIYNILNGVSENIDSDAKLYDLSLNDINSIIIYKSRLIASTNGKWTIDNSKGYLTSYLNDINEQKKQQEEISVIKAKIEVLNKWFEKYDLQVSEYNRDIALGIEPNIHIGDKFYFTINDLYLEAKSNAEQISAFRKEIENGKQ